MNALAKYDDACRMLAEAVAVDEVLEVRNQAAAIAHYARQAKNRDLEINAAHIRFRAERRLGQMVAEQKKTIGLNAGSRGSFKGKDSSGGAVSEQPEDTRPTLEQAGIDRKLSSRAQRMAAIEPVKFEQLLELHRAEVLEGNNKVSVDLMRTSAEADGRERRRNLAQVLSDASVELPSGRKYPCVYIDPPWHRNAGISDRSYENHYSTMTWSQICALKVADLLLPDAWVFIWIPRAHLLALHEIETEVTVAITGEVVLAKVEMPLAWAVAKSFGVDAYSTCYVWTKTDAENPDAKGAGLLVRDQDELLLQFKRGQGLPKPAGDEKFGSNHRERPREHSRKPEFYRQMISTMTGGLPVLEMFARVDAEHPLPAGWDAWGNQAQLAPSDSASSVSVNYPPETESGAPAGSARGNPGIDQSTAQAPRPDLAERESGEGVTAAADATSERASVAAAVTALPDAPAPIELAFPPSEWTDLQAFASLAEGTTAIAPGYIRRGLVYEFMAGVFRLTSAGEIRIKVLERERAELAARFKRYLPAENFTEWQALSAIDGNEPIDGELARGLIGVDFAWASTTRLGLTEGGRARLAELEAIVDRAAPIPQLALAPAAPKQIDLLELLQGAT